MEYNIRKEEFDVEEVQNYTSIIQTLFKALFSKISTAEKENVESSFAKEKEKPFKVAIIGQSGVGKSSTLNHLFGLNLSVSDIDEGTTEVIEKTFKMPSGFNLCVYDMPGLLQNIKKDKVYLSMYQDILPECDVIMYIIRANTRNIGDDCRIIKETVLPICKVNHIQDNLIIGINKVDTIGESEGAGWDRKGNCPTPRLVELMRKKASDICAKFISEKLLILKEYDTDSNTIAFEKFVFYSALRNYQLDKLLLAVTNAGERGWIWTGMDGYNQFLKGTK